MDENIEKITALAGNNNRYQYFTLVVATYLWINYSFITNALPYLERGPLVNYIDDEGKNQTKLTLTNDVCRETNEVYDIIETFDYSWITEYHLECKSLEIGLIGTFAFIGKTLGGVIFTFLTKCLSHKKIIIISSFGYFVVVFLCTIINSFDYFYYLLVLVLLVGFLGNLVLYSALVIAQEIVENKKRGLFGSIVNIGYALSGILYTVVFLLAQKWRTVFYVVMVASFIGLVLLWIFVYDSPKSFIAKKDVKNTIYILEGIAKFNGILDEFRANLNTEENQKIFNEIMGIDRTVVIKNEENNNNNDNKVINFNNNNPDSSNNTENRMKETINTNNNNNIEKTDTEKQKVQEFGMISIFKFKSIRGKFLILDIIWIGTRAAFNGVSISSKSFPGNFYVNIIVLYIIESVAYFVAGILIEIHKLGRKGTLWIMNAILIIAFLILAFLKMEIAPLLAINYIARFSASAIEVIYYTYSIEVYPTPVRNAAFGVNCTLGNIGSVVVFLILEFVPNWVFLTIFAAITLLNTGLLIFLPETVGKSMVETIEELRNKDIKEDEKNEQKNEEKNDEK